VLVSNIWGALQSAGIAWGLWEIGLEDIALQVLRLTDNHPLLWDSANIFYGVTGYGMTCLHFYHKTGDNRWLKIAEEIGCRLLESKLEDENGNYFWPSKDGQTQLGYANGASGVALFCLYLSLSTKENTFLKLGQRALAFDLSFVRQVEEGHLSIARGNVGSFEDVFTHYWIDGSAGVASVLVRYWAYTKDPHYLHLLEQLAPDTFRKFAAFPGLFSGLAGFGNFLLDAYQFTQDKRYLYEAQRVASGIELFKIYRPTGIAFPGEQLYRISTDLGTGSSGIALFLHRMSHIEQKPCSYNFNFCLDYLLYPFLRGGDM
jgi:lantibiotic modifying enzyme